MSACTGTRVPTNTGMPPNISGSERTTDVSFMGSASQAAEAHPIQGCLIVQPALARRAARAGRPYDLPRVVFLIWYPRQRGVVRLVVGFRLLLSGLLLLPAMLLAARHP